MAERCEECGRVSATFRDLYVNGRPVERTDLCHRANQAEDYYDNGQNEDCATYPLRLKIAQLESELANAREQRDKAEDLTDG